jgi:hypothetical protein
MSKQELQIFADGVNYAIEHESELKRLYGGDIYLAIYGNEGVIGSDKSESLLLKKLGNREGILISTLDDITAKADESLEEEKVN